MLSLQSSHDIRAMLYPCCWRGTNCLGPLTSGAQLLGHPSSFLIGRWTLDVVRQQQCQLKSYFKLQVFVFTWQCVAYVPAYNSRDDDLAQGHVRSQLTRFMLIFVPFYRELKKIKGRKMLKDKGYFQLCLHWQSGSSKGTAEACCTWTITRRCFEE